MSDVPEPSGEEVRRQLQKYVSSLKSAGVAWLPILADEGIAAELANVPPPAENAAAEKPAASLFAAAAEEPPAVPADERRKELILLAQRVAGCTRCTELARTRKQTVFGVGQVDPELCFVGEAPGYNEDQQGEPFVGDAGQLLNRIIAACGMKREEVYICNIIKCRPPGNRLPLPDEASHCREYLLRQIELVRPKFICALGACAAQNLLGTTETIGRLRGRFHSFRGIPVMCTYHPAYLLRNPNARRPVWEDMQQLMDRMGRPVPKQEK